MSFNGPTVLLSAIASTFASILVVVAIDFKIPNVCLTMDRRRKRTNETKMSHVRRVPMLKVMVFFVSFVACALLLCCPVNLFVIASAVDCNSPRDDTKSCP
jgi:archaellum biogenesis protein FlaJ (TadC family)